MPRCRKKKKGELQPGLETVFNYSYSIDIIRRSILLVIKALTSLRGATKSLEIFSDIAQRAIPSHTAIQNWVLQYGLYQLTCPLERRTDWIFILDHTIEFGSKKCLAVLGVALEEVTKCNKPITHEQVRVLGIDISQHSSGELIHRSLEKIIEKTNAPIQIVSDGGSDLKKALGLTFQQHPEIRLTYDITHKCGLILKSILDRDMRWHRFLDDYALTKRKCVHSQFAFIAPKKLKDKSRWMNLDTCVAWATKVLAFRKRISQKAAPLQLPKGFTKAFDKTFGWLEGFAESIQKWQSILRSISIARNEVKANGLRSDSLLRFNTIIQQYPQCVLQAQEVITQLQVYFEKQTDGIGPAQKYLGTSDIIESVFAKYKNFSARTPMKGVGKSVLTIPAFLSTITAEKVAAALQSTSIKQVNDWLRKNIGQSIFSQRMVALNSCEMSV